MSMTEEDRQALDILFRTSNWESMGTVAEVINTWADVAFPDRVPESSLSKLVLEEIPELLLAKRKGAPNLGEEWADCMILLLDLAIIWGIEPSKAILRKMKINADRQWVKDEATGFYNHRSDNEVSISRGSNQAPPNERRPAVDNSPRVEGPDCSGAPLQGVGPFSVPIYLLGRWHTPQLLRAGSRWVLGSCTRCGRDLDWGLTLPNKVNASRNLAGSDEEAEGTGVE